jgi:phosphohistidine swiveling domain-containing protein
MDKTLIKSFTQISKDDTEIAGGKGASLGEMTQAGIPVPDGFVILSNAFDRFLEETYLKAEIDAVLNTVDVKEVHTVEDASEKIQAMILDKQMPEDIKTEILKFYKKLNCKFVAVRSSATSEDSASASWAGQLDSFLNTTEKTLLENVKKCWASLYTPRAIFYRCKKKFSKDKISVAVVVQKMVNSAESGTAFSVHPVTQKENQIIIEAGFGLGEAIVSGSITPNSYVVDKQGFSILDINVNEQTKALYKKAKGGNEWRELTEKGKKQVLTKKEIVELSKLIVKIEKHYNFPCDIEWAKEKGEFYVVQSRPITTLEDKNRVEEFTYLVTKPAATQRDYFFMKYCFEKGLKKMILKQNHDKYDFLLEKKSWNMVLNSEFHELIIKRKWVNFITDFPIVKKALIDASFKLAKSKLPQDIIKNYDEYNAHLDKLARYFVVAFAVENVFFSKLETYLYKNFPTKSKEFLAIITSPTNLIEYQKFQIDVVQSKHSNTFSKRLNAFVDKYSWFSMYTFTDTPYDKNYFYSVLKDFTKEPALGKICSYESSIAKNKKDVQKLLSKIDDPDVKLIAEAVNRFITLRTERVDVWRMTMPNLKKFYHYTTIQVEKKVKSWKIDDTLNLSRQEVKQFYISHQIPSVKKIRQRLNADEIIYTHQHIEIVKHKKEEDKIKTQDVLKGIVAYNDKKVRGRVVIIRDVKDIDSVNKNNILVAHMTSPEYIPGIIKCGAIITDEGGITCHASIISRELKKPCIIGTRNATRILSDGNLVEVDTDQGVVRILK